MKINSLTGLRFIFCTLVFLHHLDMFNDLNIPGWEGVMKYLFEGFIGVNFFFVLSGFVISYAYGKKIKEKLIGGSSFLFYRFARLWPLHIITLIATIILYENEINLQTVVHITLLQSLIPHSSFAFFYNGVAWCVSVEMIFYFVFLFLAPASTKRLSFLLVGLIIVVIYMINFIGVDGSTGTYNYYISPVFRSIDFIIGILLQRIIAYRKSNHIENRIAFHILEVSSIFLLTIFVLYAIQDNVNLLWRYDLYYIIPIAFLMFSFQFGKGFLSKILASRFFVFLGEISFPFYLIHQIILGQVRIYWGQYIVSIKSAFIFAAISFALSILVGTALYYLVERPANKALRKVWDTSIIPFANRAKEFLSNEFNPKV